MLNTILHDQTETSRMQSMVVPFVGQEQRHFTIVYHCMSRNMSSGSRLAYVGYQIHNQLVTESYIPVDDSFCTVLTCPPKRLLHVTTFAIFHTTDIEKKKKKAKIGIFG